MQQQSWRRLLTVLQITNINTLHRKGKLHKVSAEKADILQRTVSKPIIDNVLGRNAQATAITEALRELLIKVHSKTWENFIMN